MYGILLSCLGWCPQVLLGINRQATKRIYRTVGPSLAASLKHLGLNLITYTLKYAPQEPLWLYLIRRDFSKCLRGLETYSRQRMNMKSSSSPSAERSSNRQFLTYDLHFLLMHIAQCSTSISSENFKKHKCFLTFSKRYKNRTLIKYIKVI